MISKTVSINSRFPKLLASCLGSSGSRPTNWGAGGRRQGSGSAGLGDARVCSFALGVFLGVARSQPSLSTLTTGEF